MSWGKVKKINSDMSKTLDVLITEKTNIKIQTLTFGFGRSGSRIEETIDEVDVSKSIIIPLSYINDVNTSSVTFGFVGNNGIYCTRTLISTPSDVASLYCTLAVITFGATVV